jgi:hypothetical protein
MNDDGGGQARDPGRAETSITNGSYSAAHHCGVYEYVG